MDFEGLNNQLRKIVSESHGVALSAIYLLQPRSIPKTSSGKIARQWVKKVLLNSLYIVNVMSRLTFFILSLRLIKTDL